MASSSTPGWFVAKMCRIRYLGGGFGFMPSARLTTRVTDPGEHRHERARLHEDEGLGRLAGHGLRHEGLARARRPPQEDPARHVPAAALDRLRILEEHHVLLDTVQDRVLPFHVGESGLDV